MAKTNESTSRPDVEVVVVPPADYIIETWFIETFHGRGLHVEDFNHFRRQTDALKARLAAAKE